MKLRFFGSSIRVRLDDDECRDLADGGRVEYRLALEPGGQGIFTCLVEIGQESMPPLQFRDGCLRVRVRAGEARRLADGENDAIEAAHCPAGRESVKILVERDYRP